MMKHDKSGAFPMLAVLVIIGFVLLLVGWIVIAVTFEMALAVILVGAGLYLLVKSERLAGFGPQGKMLVPLVLIVLGIAVYAGWLMF